MAAWPLQEELVACMERRLWSLRTRDWEARVSTSGRSMILLSWLSWSLTRSQLRTKEGHLECRFDRRDDSPRCKALRI